MHPKMGSPRSTPRFRRFNRMSAAVLFVSLFIVIGSLTEDRNTTDSFLSATRSVKANNARANLLNGNFNFSVNSGNPNQINSNDNWSAVPSVEGYFGQNLTATHGVDPQTVLGTEFPANNLPSSANTQVSANKGNPNAFNAGGLAEFDSGPYLAIGLQGNVQANPYLVFFMNSLGRGAITISYDLIDIDGGSNDAISPVALQYRIGVTGNFINVPAGYVADVTDGPTIAGRISSRTVQLPNSTSNKAHVQIRLITTNAANAGGGSSPDEWIGVNSVAISSLAPSSAQVEISGRAVTSKGIGISRAIVTMTDPFGRTFTAMTNSFGYYNFREVNAGSTVVIEARAKGYTFDTQVVTAFDSISELDLVATE